MMKNRAILAGLGCAALLLGAAPAARAATLYLEPDAGTFQPGETAAVNVRLETVDECVNAAEVTISYPRELLDVVDVSTGDSIFTVWVSYPKNRPEFGVITFTGGIPGGYCGRTPGDPAVTNVLAKIIVQFRDPGAVPAEAKMNILSFSKVALADGLGTEAPLTLRGAAFAITDAGRPLRNDWSDVVRNDKLPPEAFTVEIVKDPSMFEGKYFAVFGTLDKQTGVDRYEALEVRNRKDIESPHAEWRRVESPYVLENQSRTHYLFIRALDKAGNGAMTEVPPSESAQENRLIFWIVSSVALAILFVLRFLRVIPI